MVSSILLPTVLAIIVVGCCQATVLRPKKQVAYNTEYEKENISGGKQRQRGGKKDYDEININAIQGDHANRDLRILKDYGSWGTPNNWGTNNVEKFNLNKNKGNMYFIEQERIRPDPGLYYNQRHRDERRIKDGHNNLDGVQYKKKVAANELYDNQRNFLEKEKETGSQQIYDTQSEGFDDALEKLKNDPSLSKLLVPQSNPLSVETKTHDTPDTIDYNENPLVPISENLVKNVESDKIDKKLKSPVLKADPGKIIVAISNSKNDQVRKKPVPFDKSQSKDKPKSHDNVGYKPVKTIKLPRKVDIEKANDIKKIEKSPRQVEEPSVEKHLDPDFHSTLSHNKQPSISEIHNDEHNSLNSNPQFLENNDETPNEDGKDVIFPHDNHFSLDEQQFLGILNPEFHKQYYHLDLLTKSPEPDLNSAYILRPTYSDQSLNEQNHGDSVLPSGHAHFEHSPKRRKYPRKYNLKYPEYEGVEEIPTHSSTRYESPYYGKDKKKFKNNEKLLISSPAEAPLLEKMHCDTNVRPEDLEQTFLKIGENSQQKHPILASNIKYFDSQKNIPHITPGVSLLKFKHQKDTRKYKESKPTDEEKKLRTRRRPIKRNGTKYHLVDQHPQNKSRYRKVTAEPVSFIKSHLEYGDEKAEPVLQSFKDDWKYRPKLAQGLVQNRKIGLTKDTKLLGEEDVTLKLIQHSPDYNEYENSELQKNADDFDHNLIDYFHKQAHKSPTKKVSPYSADDTTKKLSFIIDSQNNQENENGDGSLVVEGNRLRNKVPNYTDTEIGEVKNITVFTPSDQFHNLDDKHIKNFDDIAENIATKRSDIKKCTEEEALIGHRNNIQKSPWLKTIHIGNDQILLEQPTEKLKENANKHGLHILNENEQNQIDDLHHQQSNKNSRIALEEENKIKMKNQGEIFKRLHRLFKKRIPHLKSQNFGRTINTPNKLSKKDIISNSFTSENLETPEHQTKIQKSRLIAGDHLNREKLESKANNIEALLENREKYSIQNENIEPIQTDSRSLKIIGGIKNDNGDVGQQPLVTPGQDLEAAKLLLFEQEKQGTDEEKSEFKLTNRKNQVFDNKNEDLIKNLSNTRLQQTNKEVVPDLIKVQEDRSETDETVPLEPFNNEALTSKQQADDQVLIDEDRRRDAESQNEISNNAKSEKEQSRKFKIFGPSILDHKNTNANKLKLENKHNLIDESTKSNENSGSSKAVLLEKERPKRKDHSFEEADLDSAKEKVILKLPERGIGLVENTFNEDKELSKEAQVENKFENLRKHKQQKVFENVGLKIDKTMTILKNRLLKKKIPENISNENSNINEKIAPCVKTMMETKDENEIDNVTNELKENDQSKENEVKQAADKPKSLLKILRKQNGDIIKGLGRLILKTKKQTEKVNETIADNEKTGQIKSILLTQKLDAVNDKQDESILENDVALEGVIKPVKEEDVDKKSLKDILEDTKSTRDEKISETYGEENKNLRVTIPEYTPEVNNCTNNQYVEDNDINYPQLEPKLGINNLISENKSKENNFEDIKLYGYKKGIITKEDDKTRRNKSKSSLKLQLSGIDRILNGKSVSGEDGDEKKEEVQPFKNLEDEDIKLVGGNDAEENNELQKNKPKIPVYQKSNQDNHNITAKDIVLDESVLVKSNVKDVSEENLNLLDSNTLELHENENVANEGENLNHGTKEVLKKESVEGITVSNIFNAKTIPVKEKNILNLREITLLNDHNTHLSKTEQEQQEEFRANNETPENKNESYKDIDKKKRNNSNSLLEKQNNGETDQYLHKDGFREKDDAQCEDQSTLLKLKGKDSRGILKTNIGLKNHIKRGKLLNLESNREGINIDSQITRRKSDEQEIKSRDIYYQDENISNLSHSNENDVDEEEHLKEAAKSLGQKSKLKKIDHENSSWVDNDPEDNSKEKYKFEGNQSKQTDKSSEELNNLENQSHGIINLNEEKYKKKQLANRGGTKNIKDILDKVNIIGNLKTGESKPLNLFSADAEDKILEGESKINRSKKGENYENEFLSNNDDDGKTNLQKLKSNLQGIKYENVKPIRNNSHKEYECQDENIENSDEDKIRKEEKDESRIQYDTKGSEIQDIHSKLSKEEKETNGTNCSDKLFLPNLDLENDPLDSVPIKNLNRDGLKEVEETSRDNDDKKCDLNALLQGTKEIDKLITWGSHIKKNDQESALNSKNNKNLQTVTKQLKEQDDINDIKHLKSSNIYELRDNIEETKKQNDNDHETIIIQNKKKSAGISNDYLESDKSSDHILNENCQSKIIGNEQNKNVDNLYEFSGCDESHISNKNKVLKEISKVSETDKAGLQIENRYNAKAKLCKLIDKDLVKKEQSNSEENKPDKISKDELKLKSKIRSGNVNTKPIILEDNNKFAEKSDIEQIENNFSDALNLSKIGKIQVKDAFKSKTDKRDEFNSHLKDANENHRALDVLKSNEDVVSKIKYQIYENEAKFSKNLNTLNLPRKTVKAPENGKNYIGELDLKAKVHTNNNDNLIVPLQYEVEESLVGKFQLRSRDKLNPKFGSLYRKYLQRKECKDCEYEKSFLQKQTFKESNEDHGSCSPQENIEIIKKIGEDKGQTISDENNYDRPKSLKISIINDLEETLDRRKHPKRNNNIDLPVTYNNQHKIRDTTNAESDSNDDSLKKLSNKYTGTNFVPKLNYIEEINPIKLNEYENREAVILKPDISVNHGKSEENEKLVNLDTQFKTFRNEPKFESRDENINIRDKTSRDCKDDLSILNIKNPISKIIKSKNSNSGEEYVRPINFDTIIRTKIYRLSKLCNICNENDDIIEDFEPEILKDNIDDAKDLDYLQTNKEVGSEKYGADYDDDSPYNYDEGY